MTTKPVVLPPDAPDAPNVPGIIQFAPPPPDEMTAFFKVNFPGYPNSLADHFGSPETTIITSEIAAALMLTPDWEGVRYPDLLIAFNVDPAAGLARNGYLIPEQGKPPDFVLEIASERTGYHDETVKRQDYARMGVPEYWRFDPTGGRFYRVHRTHIAGDRLVDGEYRPITIYRIDDAHYWGHSGVLNLDLCWENGELRWYDPATQRYLPTFDDERAARRAESNRADAERAARIAAEAQRDSAEARVRQLEAQLRRQQNPGPPETP